MTLAFWRGKSVLLTGHTGFKGAWMSLWLNRLGAQVTGVSLALESAKARTVLGAQPRWTLVESVQRNVHWYRQQHEGADARSLCEADISAYETANESSGAS
jgi:nucleoside-diphosphate-sugar epimerase